MPEPTTHEVEVEVVGADFTDGDSFTFADKKAAKAFCRALMAAAARLYEGKSAISRRPPGATE